MQKNKLAQFEFVTLMASLMSIVALAIDALLPALDIIGITIGTRQIADNQLLITMIFLGLGIGPLVFGPISDSIGRKPVVYVGFVLFIIASFICIFATSVEMMVLGRILQGIGLSAPRTIAIAMIRDIYSGDYMARIMSFITVVFILVPIIAPALGKFVLDHYDWQAIFYIQVLFSLLVSFWFWKRQAETLEISKRIKFTSTIFMDGLKELMQYKTTMGYTLISGFIVGSFMVYLSTSQQIFEQQYQLKEEFPYIFGLLAISIGSAIFLNGTLVLKYGMEKLVTTSLLAFFGISLLYIVLFYNSSNPSVEVLLLFFGMQFFAIGFLFGNLRALAMQPIGHIAGIGAAITGFVSTIMAVPISTYIGRFVLNTTLPLFIGFLVCALLSIVILVYIKVAVKKQSVTR
ncbi:multidrug effflux MFS transporter [Aquimarina macrocephali]|uniref:multidrug effflux MFS transporter n=1 Tax=Aquimarina macrocephali TaxID=666563 RepID=UPI0004642CDD|nr:multidrug effflux MFS transporter [Aquimarina macrocephali]